MAAKKYRAAAIGHTGRGDYGHGLHLAYKNQQQVELVALADPDEEGRAKAQAESDAAKTYSDYEQMLREERPDIVSVGPRWTDKHLEMVLACLEAGAHVYCEKPLTASLEEGDQIVSMAQAAGRKVAVAHQGVYLPRIRRLKEYLAEGSIGQLQSIRAQGKSDRRGGGEDMIVLGTHLFNMMRFLVGDVDWMSAHITAKGRELAQGDITEPTEPVGLVAGDCVNSYFSFKSGVAGFYESRRDQVGSSQRFGMDLVGSEGMVSLRGGTGSELMVYPYPVYRPADLQQQWEPLKEAPDNSIGAGNRLAIVDLIAAIEEDREPLSSARDAVAALEMILGAYESQITGARVDLPMQRRHPLNAWRDGLYGR